jgi:ABC-type enterochelin transport system ATPase subunit
MLRFIVFLLWPKLKSTFFLLFLLKVRNADKIIVLKDGRAFEEGTHDELLLKNGLYAEMWNMQLHSTSTSTSQSNLLSV